MWRRKLGEEQEWNWKSMGKVQAPKLNRGAGGGI